VPRPISQTGDQKTLKSGRLQEKNCSLALVLFQGRGQTTIPGFIPLWQGAIEGFGKIRQQVLPGDRESAMKYPGGQPRYLHFTSSLYIQDMRDIEQGLS
jgi:hypothetical protein